MRSISSQISRLGICGFALCLWSSTAAPMLAQETKQKDQLVVQGGVTAPTIQATAIQTEPVAFDDASATVPKKARRTLVLSLESLDQRILLEPRETVVLQIANTLSTNESIELSAPSGGNINGGKGHAKLSSPADLQNVQFAVGAAPGLYVLEVKHEKESRTVEFWVGPVPPIGQPGPARLFIGN